MLYLHIVSIIYLNTCGKGIKLRGNEKLLNIKHKNKMKRLLSTLTLLLCFAFTAVNAQGVYDQATMGAKVVEMETASWGQNSPFNKYCVTNAGATAKTGCVPTAFAIVMRYHGFPEAGIGTLLNQQTKEEFTNRTYDWNNMPLTYSSSWTDEQKDQVSKLMHHLGHAFGVTYGQGETSVSIGNTMTEKMRDYFNYNYVDVSNQYNNGSMYDFGTWKNNLKNSLLNGCPVPYAANNKGGTGDTRHMFVVDGYTENDYFHFNFGWNGSDNGWYKLDNITPTGCNYSWLDSGDGYDSKHQAYFNLTPNKTTYPVTATTNSSNMGTVSINGGTAGNTATANLFEGATATLTAHPADGYALASWTKNGVIVSAKNTIQVTVGTDANDYVANFDEAANVLVNKDYVVNPTNGSLSDGISKYSTWTSTDNQPALTLKATNASGAAVYAMSALTSSYKAYATAYDSSDKAHTTVTYTLSVPEGYVIKNYTMTYVVGDANANQITLNGTLLSSAGTFDLSATPNTQTASFTMSVSSVGQQYITVKSIEVNVQSVGSGSTPTPDPEPEPEPEPTPVTYTVTTTANPAAGGTAKFAVGTGGQQTQGDVENGTQITLYATANTGYNFVNWTLNGAAVSTDATCNVNVAQAANYVANFEAVQQGGEETPLPEPEYQAPTGNTNENNYLTSAKTTGALENVTYSANAHPGVSLVTVLGTVRVEKGRSFTLNLVAYSLGAGSNSTVREDMRYCHASLFTDFDRDGSFGSAIQTWGTKPPSHNVYGNYDQVMDISATINVPANAPLGTSHVRMVYTNAWTDFPAGNSPALDKGIVYDFVVEVVETVVITASASEGGTVKINNEAIETKNVVKGSEVTLVATPQNGYEFVNWTKGGAEVSTEATYTFAATETASFVANFEELPQTDPLAGKWFRLKENNNNRYMNVKNHTAHAQKVSAGGVNVAAKDENSNAQKFFFEKSGDGYMLKDGDGYYINCLEWSVDASSTTSGSVLLFEETATESIYYIKWNNTYKGGVKYFKVGADSNGTGDHPYCDADNKTVTWTLEEVIPSNERTLNVTFGNLWSASEVSQIVTKDSPAITITEVNGANKIGYSTKDDGKHPFLLKGGQFTISVPAPYKIASYTLAAEYYAFNNSTVEYTDGSESTATATISNGAPSTLSATGLNNSEICINLGDATGTPAGLIITSLEITYIEDEFTPLPFKAEIEGWRNDNPNTHLGTITIGGTPLKLTPEHLTASELTMPLNAGTTLAFTRKYRGFEFQGFYIGTTSLGESATLTDEQIAAINETTPLVAKFTATDDVTLFYDDDEFSYRIPAIAKTSTNRLVAISDYRHSHDDIGRDNHYTGTLQVDLVMRTSEDNGLTWTDKVTIAEGNSNFGYGDAAVAVNGENILVMAVAGNVFFTNATATNKQKTYRIYSTNNGQSWEKQEVSNNLYTLFPNANGMFFGSGKLVVDPDFNGTGNARVYGAMLLNDGNNYVLYSDNWGETWNILGGKAAASANEPKVEILPNGQILLSSRRNGGRTFNVFTYTDKANNAGNWDSAVNGCDNGGNATNGEIICLDAKCTNGKPTKILLQSQPSASDRRNVSIWYKELSGDNFTASGIANGWTKGLQVSNQLSAYSAMCLQENGEIALFFEEAPCHNDDATYGYSMVYVPLTIEEITENNFLNPNADVEYVPVEFNIELTDAEGNIYSETLDYKPDDVAAALTAKYPFITLGENGVTTDNKYTNTVTLPFKVSNAETTAWYNIYFPAYDNAVGYPVYMMSDENSNVIKIIAEREHYGNSQYNTLNYADRLSWAIYSVDNTLTFKFKNKAKDSYIKTTNTATSSNGGQNVIYIADINDATAFSITDGRSNSYHGEYAITNGDGCVCVWSYSDGNVTYTTNSSHHGAWAKFVEAPDYQAIVDALIADINNFGAGEGKYVADDAISGINKDALATMPINSLNTQKETVKTVKDNYSEITLTVPVTNSGSVKIKNEAVSNKFVKKGEVTIEAVPAAGYYFVNWTKPAAQETAAARNVEARNAVDVVSTDNPYTFNLTDAVSLEANFGLVVVTATLTDGQGNQYIVELDGFTNGITKETVAAKLVEKYPYITLGTADGGITLEGDDAAYTYTNTVTLPFKVSNTTAIWHNIYWPSNNTSNSGYPNYLAALNEDEIVDMAASPSHAYGDNPDYNTNDGDKMISWAIYNVNNGFEFIFKNKSTGKYIKVESVSDKTAQNVNFVENAEDATVFTLLKDNATYNGDYALVANVGDATGYLCATSSNTNYVTHFDRTNHQGAWAKFVESPDYYSKIMDLGIMLGMKFSAGDGKCIITPSIQEVIDEMQNSGSITLNALTEYSSRMEGAMNNWPAVSVTINPNDGGTTSINGEENVVHKYVPNGYGLALVATPAEGYHFDKWVDGTNEITTAEYTKTISGGKGDVIALTAKFAKNNYTISVSAGEGGSAYIGAQGTTEATVEHGDEVTLTAVANDGYRFVNWTKGTDVVSITAEYTINNVTADGEYVANFELATAPVTYYTVKIETEGLSNDKFAAYIHTGTTQNETQKSYEAGSTVKLLAIQDNSNVGSYDYAFEGWYLNGTFVSGEEEIEFTIGSNVTYTAKFVEGIRIGVRAERGWPHIYLDGSNKEVGGTSMSTILVPGRRLKLSVDPEYGCRFVRWTVGDEEVSTKNPFTTEPLNETVTFKAICEPASYQLTVRANDDNFGTVSAESVAGGSGTEIIVGHNMEATITATANPGYRFVNWTTKNGEEVSTNATYTIAGIENVEDMVDVKYVANFVEIGTYYRIAYKFEVPVETPAKSAATRAAGDVVNIDLTTGTFEGLVSGEGVRTIYSQWLSANGVRIIAEDKDNNEVTAMRNYNGFQLYINSLESLPIKYTIIVPEGYTLTSMKFKNGARTNDMTVVYGSETYSLKNDASEKTITFTEGNTSFTLSGTVITKNILITALTMIENAEATPEPETKTVKYYVQSEDCGVDGKNKALVMKSSEVPENCGASSIFYYADNKLMSYAKGRYVNENGNIRGLQSVGVDGGYVEIIDNKIKVSNDKNEAYMHAKESNGIYYVDNCGATATCGNDEHNFILEEVKSLPVTISAAGYASWYAPVAVELPDDVEAWYFEGKIGYKGEDKYAIMTPIVGNVVPANTGVILGGPEGKYELKITETDTEIEGNLLTGTVAAEYVEDDAYVLANGNNGVGLYLADRNIDATGNKITDETKKNQEGTRFKNNSHKAYLLKDDLPSPAQHISGFRFSFGDDNITPIEEVETESSEVKGIYDLTGRKLEGISGAGIYIINGKKVMVK